MLTKEKLAQLNDRPPVPKVWLLITIVAGALVVAALLALLTPYAVFAFAVLLAGGAGVWGVYRGAVAKVAVSLTYDLDSDSDLATRFAAVRRACEALASSEKVWLITDRPHNLSADAHGDTFQPREREPARVGLLETPGIRANVPIWGIEAGETRAHFFPETVLLYRRERYESVPYRSFSVVFSPARFFEEGPIAEDAEFLEHAWRFRKADGSPERLMDNRRMPVVLYGLIEISGPSEFGLRLQVSNRDAAAAFAVPFETVRDREEAKRRERRQRRMSADLEYWAELRARARSARGTLGVADGASAAEIRAAYRELARAYHPDKVAHLAPEDRELAEQRMKEVNAAYAELERQRKRGEPEGSKRVG